MKTIIAGTRDAPPNVHQIVDDAIVQSGFEITEVVSGCCRGVDRAGELWASLHEIPVKHFKPDWKHHGKAGGPKRNREMANYADALIAIRSVNSKGTVDMIKQAVRLKLLVHVVDV